MLRRRRGRPAPPRETLYSTPIAAMVNTSEVLPALMRGNGMPVGGMLPLTTRALTSTCTAYEAEMPAASKKPNRSRLRPAAAMPCQMRATAA